MNGEKKYPVETAVFPSGVLAAAAPLSDGRYVIVVSSRLSEDDQQAAVREMIRRL